jgi:hypothetical protein
VLYGAKGCAAASKKSGDEGVGEVLVVGSLRTMCDSSIRNKKFCSADFMFLHKSHLYIRHLRVAMD